MLIQYNNLNEKRRAYRMACEMNYLAWDSRGREYLLRDVNIDNVEYIGGAWRVQNKFDYQIQMVRGREFVLGERLNRTEKNLFEFYSAQTVGRNCYGRFLINGGDAVVAKYVRTKKRIGRTAKA